MKTMKNDHYYSAFMIENGVKEFVVFKYRCATYYITGRAPFSIDQKNVSFDNIKCLGSQKDLLA